MIRRHDRSTPRQVYRLMRPAALLLLQEAFSLDRQATESPICRQFCDERLALIVSVLKEKAAVSRDRTRKREAR